jgi:putative zinc finger/helix-turn-helix YgiT family protein
MSASQPEQPHAPSPSQCPFCGAAALREARGDFHFDPPSSIPGGTIVIPDALWYACDACHEQVIPHNTEQAIEAERNRRLGLLTPDEIRDVRHRAGLSAVEMASLLGVGEKTYTRWESGRSIHNKSSDTLIRLADRYANLFEAVEAQRDVARDKTVRGYIASLALRRSATGSGGIDTYGIDLGALEMESIRMRLVQLKARRAAT